jgi:hypothetical protein
MIILYIMLQAGCIENHWILARQSDQSWPRKRINSELQKMLKDINWQYTWTRQNLASMEYLKNLARRSLTMAMRLVKLTRNTMQIICLNN